MTKISDLSDGGTLQSTDELIVVRSGGNARAKMNTLPDMTVSQSPSVPSSSAQIFYNSTKGAVLRGQGSTSDVRLENDLGEAALTVKTGTKLVGVATASPTRTLDVNGGLGVTHSENDGVKITANDTVGNSSFAAVHVDYNASGSDTLSGDRQHAALEIDVDSSATGGDTSNEHRLYGLWNHTLATGDSDLVYGAYHNAEAQHSSGQISSLYGVYGRAEADVAGGTLSQSYGVVGASVIGNSAGVTQTSAYGVFGKTTSGSTNYAPLNNLHGGYFEIQLDEPAAANIPVSYLYGVRVEIDINDDGSGNGYDLTSTNSYLFYGNYATQSQLPGNAYGLYILDDVQNYLRGSLDVRGAAIFNDGSVDVDFRVETNNYTHALFVDGGNDRVGILNSAPAHALDVGGNVNCVGLYSQSLYVTAQGGSGVTQGDIRISSATIDSPASRGQGVFTFNHGADVTWYTGTIYGDGDRYQIGYAEGTSLNVDAARSDAGVLNIYTTAGGVIFNPQSGDRDFRVKSTNNANMLRVDAGSDRVLIGTSSGTGTLHIFQAASGTESGPHLRIQVNDSTAGSYSAFQWLDGTAYYIGQNSNSRAVRIYSGPETAGVALAASATSWSTFSDERLKFDVEPIDNALETLCELRTVSYRLEGVDSPSDPKKYGVVAQDLVGQFDDLIDPMHRAGDDTEYMGVRYTELVPVIIKGMQQQTEMINQLKAQVAQLTS